MRRLARLLGPAGHAVEEFGTGGAALERTRRDPHDLVLLDLDLPDMNGQDAVEALRASFAEAATAIAPGLVA